MVPAEVWSCSYLLVSSLFLPDKSFRYLSWNSPLVWPETVAHVHSWNIKCNWLNKYIFSYYFISLGITYKYSTNIHFLPIQRIYYESWSQCSVRKDPNLGELIYGTKDIQEYNYHITQFSIWHFQKYCNPY